MEQFERAVVTLNDKVSEDIKKLVTAKKLTSDEVENYIQFNKPISTDIYKFLAADGTFKNYKNITVLFIISLLIHLRRQMLDVVFPS